MSNRVVYSRDSEQCRSCKHYDNCDEKRKELCAAMYLTSSATPASADMTMDVMIKHNYRNVKIAENTTVTIDLEEIKQNLKDEIYKGLRLDCKFLREG